MTSAPRWRSDRAPHPSCWRRRSPCRYGARRWVRKRTPRCLRRWSSTYGAGAAAAARPTRLARHARLTRPTAARRIRRPSVQFRLRPQARSCHLLPKRDLPLVWRLAGLLPAGLELDQHAGNCIFGKAFRRREVGETGQVCPHNTVALVLKQPLQDARTLVLSGRRSLKTHLFPSPRVAGTRIARLTNSLGLQAVCRAKVLPPVSTPFANCGLAAEALDRNRAFTPALAAA